MFTALKPRMMLVAALCLASAACATPYGGAAMLAANTQTAPTHGFSVSSPDLIASPAGPRIHGSICRQSPTPVTGPREVRIEHLGPGMKLIEAATVRPSGNLSGRPGPGCAYYDLQTRWTIGRSDTVRVCGLGGDAACREGAPRS